MNALYAISPLDGRYQKQVAAIAPFCSEAALIRYRVLVEVEWFKALSAEPAIEELSTYSDSSWKHLQSIIDNFDSDEAEKVKTLEATTKHDVKAVEYYLQQCFDGHDELKTQKSFIHFACTSEDINNLAYALMAKDMRSKILLPALDTCINKLMELTEAHSKTAMLCRTHGQAASPSTAGKEFANIALRLMSLKEQWLQQPILGKFNGAVGNYNAHVSAYPDANWLQISRDFIESIGLHQNLFTTQIEPHDWLAQLCRNLQSINTVVVDACRDCWGYISLGYFSQKVSKGQVGSSTMPHKINPIDFENAEGNLGLANALLEHFSSKLPISRWQRDLTDSTVLRNLGVAWGHTLLGLQNYNKGLNGIAVNEQALEEDLSSHWELMAEPIQTVMRRAGRDDAYEIMKDATQGKTLDQRSFQALVETLDIDSALKTSLIKLSPMNYTGLATQLCDHALQIWKSSQA